MSRRLLGPVGGPIVFFLVAAGVFAGLGWVTYSAIGVEHAQRRAAARADLGNNLRVALWQLDGRVLPALGVEDSRPYFHYAPGDPAMTPLVGAPLPEWMKLHFQLDSDNGWVSPQVLDDDEEARQVRLAWADLPTSNLNGERSELRDTLREKFPPAMTCEVFAARDRVTAADPLPLAAPFITNEANSIPGFDQPQSPRQPTPDSQSQQLQQPAQPTPGGPVAPGDATSAPLPVFGIDLRWLARLNPSEQRAENNPPPTQGAQRGAPTEHSQLGPPPRQASPSQSPNTRGGRKMDGYLSRAQTIGNGLQEAKNAAGYPMGRVPYSQNQMNFHNVFDPRNPGNTGGSTTHPTGPGLTPPTYNPTIPPPGGGYGGFPAVPGGGSMPLPGAGGFGGVGGVGGGGFNFPQKDAETLDKLKEAENLALGTLATLVGDRLRLARDKDHARKLAEELRKELETETGNWFSRFRELADDAKTGDRAGRSGQDDRVKDKPRETAPPTPGPAPPGPPAFPPPLPPIASPDGMPVVMPQVAIHLGSMRPQWLTAPDGTQMLVLVRTAKFNDHTVYQGVVVDWEKLQEELLKEVNKLFPSATLVPVHDPADALPDRSMTTLPVQLDPGPEPELPPAGWTPLRIGLVLAWVAALVAFVAVGLSGWSLIDLAERRIRFVSAVTHELRTPLTSLRLYLDLLVSGMIQDEVKRQEYLKTLTVESDRLHRLVDNVLDYAKLEKRKKNGDIKPVKVNELMDQLRETWSDRVSQDGKELVVISTLPPEQEVSTDPAMIQQIVGNLIDNARKYTRDAADRRIWVWAKPGVGSGVILEVEDRGSGVPASERKTIFKPFRRGEHADSKAGGAGLGLALAKSWAEVLGATLTCHPADGGTGACFRLELPGK